MPVTSIVPATPRQVATLLTAFTGAALAGGTFVQYGLGHLPCPLCVLQRLAYIVVLSLALTASIFPLGLLALRSVAVLVAVAAFAGFAVATYQVGTNVFSIEVARCGRGPAGYFEDTPLAPLANWLLDAGGDCGNPVQFFGFLTMPQLGLAGFAIVLAVSLRLWWAAFRPPKVVKLLGSATM
jgi:disulfide bond formation protein DsbB